MEKEKEFQEINQIMLNLKIFVMHVKIKILFFMKKEIVLEIEKLEYIKLFSK